ncbi:hypothetical protein HIM_09783 [Hirsutella minnesotensis 3608]|uniref:ABC transporter domain-containing protein n=1 Tax=Hirsutella minnesotensis 3608 TaxID=1043627 RepID=A0A0F8A2X2_9HYPO|nr:hypothetical protein HIM_09783 [Hirsutella minnesotensis 3608]
MTTSSSSTAADEDPEKGLSEDECLFNSTIKSFVWSGVTIHVKDKNTKKPRAIIDDAAGVVNAGEICALMGPSGCGKTTLLNALASRPNNASKVEANILVNGRSISASDFKRVSSFAEQEDVLIGSLTVRETLSFSSRLSNSKTSSQQRRRHIDALLGALGLSQQADALIGTPIHRGISTGQKHRVSIANQLVTSPMIVFLDEPTSGLDSSASAEVIQYIKAIASRNNLIVIFSIHQPSAVSFRLFDKLMLLSGGKTHYFGPRDMVEQYYASAGVEIPNYVNPADHLLEVLNVDFAPNKEEATDRLAKLQVAWNNSRQAKRVRASIDEVQRNPTDQSRHILNDKKKPNRLSVILILSRRSFVKSYRDALAYGIRIAMYLGLAIMMGTVWLRLEPTQSYIRSFTSAIFFGSGFMSVMAVSYVPAFLEDRFLFTKEHYNGLYGAAELVASNFLVGLPYLLSMSLIFSVVLYWLGNFHATAGAFFTWVMWLFLDLVAAESTVVLVASSVPNFVASLAIVAFINGLWMSIGNFMTPNFTLNAFYRYTFYYCNYLNYIFQGMMINEFRGRAYSCGPDCQCMYKTPLADRCEVDGQAVIDEYGFETFSTSKLVGFILAITAAFRIVAWIVLKIAK